MQIGTIHSNLNRLAVLIARRINAKLCCGMTVWANFSGNVFCAPRHSHEATLVMRDSPGFLVGNYDNGARAIDILEDLQARAREIEEASL